jgi:energy-coupling factor transporter ATP-binding protein EcfA2
MQLVSFSVTNYRSITTAYKLPVKQFTVLIGPNNEGKSNILRALVTSLEALKSFRDSKILAGRLRSYNLQMADRYSWANDFPITLQSSTPTGESIFNLEFKLTDSEIEDFYVEVKSNLNGNLPIQLTLGNKQPGFRVLKKGPGAAALSKKAEQIAGFVAKRININYIPAVRTSDAAESVVAQMLDRELLAAERDPAFQAALAEIAKLQEPILSKISAGISETLKEFLPNVKSVRVSIPQEARYRAMRRSCEIVVDDGTPTALSRKGDGVQSLAALSLLRRAPENGTATQQSILAIEEPESHLHPNAIHQLRHVLAEIAQKNQVIMTTHCPLFVDRASIRSNIIVHNNRATPARDVRQIRDILGVRAADNLQHAEIILLVEGEDDRIAIRSLLSAESKLLSGALTQGALGIESLQGGTNLSYKLSHVREALCLAHCFLDHDDCGLSASKKAEVDGLISLPDINFATCPGMKESEIEDLYDEMVYAGMIQNKFGVSLSSPKFKGTSKWTIRMRETFKHQGKPWSDKIEMEVKGAVAHLIESSPSGALNTHKRGCFDALVVALESKVNGAAAARK